MKGLVINGNCTIVEISVLSIKTLRVGFSFPFSHGSNIIAPHWFFDIWPTNNRCIYIVSLPVYYSKIFRKSKIKKKRFNITFVLNL